MRSVRHELFSTGVVLSLPAAIVLAFPFESVSFKAKDVPAECEASAAFVALSPKEETAALLAAKTSWQSDASAGQRMRIRLPLGELPAEQENTLTDVRTGDLAPRVVGPIGYSAPPWEPSQRAADVLPIKREPASDAKPAFSREELLKLN